jgi:hypothetical protein
MIAARTLIQKENVLAVASSLLAFAVYLSTLCPTVSFVDAGELATVAITFGVAHPTGYPLFTLVGRLAAAIPFGVEEIVRLNLLAAILTAAAAGWFFKTSMLFYRSSLFSMSDEDAIPIHRFRPVAMIGSLAVALSSTVWAQSVAVEVYALHLLLLCITVYCFVRGVDETIHGSALSRYLLLFSFVLGLSFTNHMTTVLLAPAFLFLYFRLFGFKRDSFERLVKLAPLFVLGLSVYLVLPVRSSMNPSLDWGHPVTFERFLWHLSGKQYRSWMFTSFDSAEKQFQYFVGHLSTEFNYFVLVVMAIGVIGIMRRSGRLFMFLSLLFLGCLLYAINYDIHDIDSYFLLAYLALGWFVVFGIAELHQWLTALLPRTATPLVWAVLVAVPLSQWLENRQGVDESGNYLIRDYTQNVFTNVEPNAFILTYQWDYLVAPSYYFQQVRKQRPDVVIVDKELLRRSWYYMMLERNHPWLIERSRVAVNRFLAELTKFEHDQPYDPSVIEMRFNEMINDFLNKAIVERPVYVGSEIEPQFAFAYQRVPEGLLFRLLRENEKPLLKLPTIAYHSPSFENDYTHGIRFLYSKMLTMNAALMYEQRENGNAREMVRRILEIDSTYEPARTLRKQLVSTSQ